MKPFPFKLKTLILVILVAVIGLGIWVYFSPFKELRHGVTYSVSDAAEYQGSDSFWVDLEPPFSGDLKCQYVDPRIGKIGFDCSDLLDDYELSLNSAQINSRGMGASRKPRLELCDYSYEEGCYTSVTTVVENLPSVEELKSLKSVSDYVELLGQPRGFTSVGSRAWQICKIRSERELEVVCIFIFTISGDAPPKLIFHHGSLKTSRK